MNASSPHFANGHATNFPLFVADLPPAAPGSETASEGVSGHFSDPRRPPPGAPDGPGLTQSDVAVRLGVTRESVDNWEHDVHSPKAKHVHAIHDFLGYCPVGLDVSNLGARLFAWRKATRVTQLEAAARIGCDETTLRDLERGRTRFLHRRTLEAIEGLFAGTAPM